MKGQLNALRCATASQNIGPLLRVVTTKGDAMVNGNRNKTRCRDLRASMSHVTGGAERTIGAIECKVKS